MSDVLPLSSQPMNTHSMMALLRKDFRLNRVPIFGGTLLVAIPYTLGLLIAIFDPVNFQSTTVRDSFIPIPFMSLVMTHVMAALFGGAAFAYERRERWSDFLLTLPVSRSSSIISKIVLSFAFVLPAWAINVAVGLLIIRNPTNDPGTIGLLLSSGSVFMCFGVAWLFSSFLSSPALSASAALGLLLTGCLLTSLIDEFHPELFRTEQAVYLVQTMAAAVGVFSAVVGTIYYLHRVEP
jgi:ABC-type transport system involved in multi-copper enzyme maturation permease subunit